jgi:hypothetical protein
MAFRCPHFDQGCFDTSHRPPCKRFVPEKRRSEFLPGEDAAEHTHGRARISAVESVAWGRQRRAATFNFDRRYICVLPVHSQRAQAVQRSRAISAGGIILKARLTFRDCRQHRITMRNRLVSGKAQSAGNMSRWAHHYAGAGLHIQRSTISDMVSDLAIARIVYP